jgi:hypothetical protein
MDEDEQPGRPLQLAIELPPDKATGVFADFANIWHTPVGFVIDFLSTKQPPHELASTGGEDLGRVLETVIAARVRIPPEQIFPLINALQEQGNAWLAETGRVEPPEAWLPHRQE